MIVSLSVDPTEGNPMSSDAEILAPGSHLGEASPDPARVLRLSGALLMLALPARRGHSAGPASV
jgi:hypothetical protein